MDALTLETLLALERRGWDALCASAGGTFYGELMTEEAVMILVNGMVFDRDTVARTLNDSPPWASYAITDARLLPIGPDTAALLYTATAEREGQVEPFGALMASHYCIARGETKLALYQQTTITH